jgi:FkbM family methyltransferase
MGILKRILGGGGDEDGVAEAKSSDDAGVAHIRAGLERQQSGDLPRAENAYREAIRVAPGNADAHYLLGGVLGARGSLDEAMAHLQRASELAPELAAARSDIANIHRAQGRFEAAEQSYREAIVIDADCFVAHRNLGDMYRQLGRTDDAIENMREAARGMAGDADTQFILGDLLSARGRYQEAAKCYQAGLLIAPEVAAAHNNLGASYRYLERIDEATKSFAEALRLDPDLGDAHSNLADMLEASGSIEAAMEHYRRAAELSGDAVHCRRRLGQLLLDARRFDEAEQQFRQVLTVEPESARAHFELGNSLMELGEVDEALERFRQSIRLDPSFADAHVNLGFGLNELKRFEEATQCFRDAIEISPDLVEAHNNLGGVLQLQGRLEPAMQCYERAMELAPDQVYIRSNLLTCMNYYADAEPEEVFRQHVEWTKFLDAPIGAAPPRRLQRGDEERRLKIGYVSADLRFHSVSFFIAPILERHDRSKFEVYCYANVGNPDANTERLKALSDHWRDIAFVDDEEVAAWIRHDGIDILVDLSGHTVGNRLPVFARRPAPVQVTYLGYPNTTGLAVMDYRLTDEHADPEGMTEHLHSETLIRLPDCFLCYQPLPSCPDIRGEFESTDDATITFASFNELLKVTPPIVAAWCEILHRVSGSRLFIKGTSLEDEGTCERVAGWFQEHGITRDRLQLVGRTATLEEHMQLYNSVDVALDTFPYNGTTTTCEAFWMGVPVVSLLGGVHASRVGLSLLRAVGLDDLVSESIQAYVDIAVSLAADTDRRGALRHQLRGRMQESVLMDADRITSNMEAAYRSMWQRACENEDEEAGAPGRETLLLKLRGDIKMSVPADLDQVTPYVLLEQEDWFEDEIDFVRKFLQPSMRCVDIGANYGIFTLNCARVVGAEGRVWSFEPTPSTAAFLSASVAANGFSHVSTVVAALSRESGTAKLVTHGDSEYNYLTGDPADDQSFEIVDVERLDDVALELRIQDIDFVKLDAEGAEVDILAGGTEFFERQSPLVMFELKDRDGIHWDLIEDFRQRGYGIYRLVPGLRILVPFASDEPDAYQLNLFACKEDRASSLEAGALLARGPGEGEPGDAPELAALERCLARRPYAREFLSSWSEAALRESGLYSEQHSAGIGLYCRAWDESLSAATRFQALSDAHAALSSSGDSSMEAARLQSLARVAWELGRRAQAVSILDALMERADARALDPGGAPFVPVSPAFDLIEPGERMHDWCLASVLDQRERLCAFSSYFNGEARLGSLERLRESPFQRAELERRLQLVQMRLGRQKGPEAVPVLQKATPDNLNLEFWTSQSPVSASTS